MLPLRTPCSRSNALVFRCIIPTVSVYGAGDQANFGPFFEYRGFSDPSVFARLTKPSIRRDMLYGKSVGWETDGLS
jgi:hypothetical protein